MNKLFILIIFILSLPLSATAQESLGIDAITVQEIQPSVEVAKFIITPSELCSQSYTIGFYNGMMNSEKEAIQNLLNSA